MSGIWLRIDVNSIMYDWTSELPDAERGAWDKALCAMKQCGRGGIAKLAAIRTLLAKCNSDPANLDAVIAKSNGHWRIVNNTLVIDNWDKFQVDFGAADRSRKYRENHPKPPVTPVTEITPTGQDVTGQDGETAPQPARESAAANCDAGMLIGAYCKKSGIPRKPWLIGELSDLINSHGYAVVEDGISRLVGPGTKIDDFAKRLNVAKEERRRQEKIDSERKAVEAAKKLTPEEQAECDRLWAEAKKKIGAPRPPVKPV